MPLWQHVLAGGKIFDLYNGVDPETPDAARVNPELVRYCRQEERLGPSGRRGPPTAGTSTGVRP